MYDMPVIVPVLTLKQPGPYGGEHPLTDGSYTQGVGHCVVLRLNALV